MPRHRLAAGPNLFIHGFRAEKLEISFDATALRDYDGGVGLHIGAGFEQVLGAPEFQNVPWPHTCISIVWYWPAP